MDYTFAMRVIERRRNLRDDGDNHLWFEVSFLLLELLEDTQKRTALNQLHRHVIAVAVFPELVDTDNVRMIQVGGGAGFADEALRHLVILVMFNRNDLDGGFAPQLFVK